MDLLNKVMIVGNLTRDPEVRQVANGKTLADLGLAVRQAGNGGRDDPPPEPVFVDVVVWDRMAENASQYLSKGSAVLIEGRLQMDSWQDKESGKTRRKLKIAGERMRFLNLGGGRDERDGPPGGSASRRREPAGARH